MTNFDGERWDVQQFFVQQFIWIQLDSFLIQFDSFLIQFNSNYIKKTIQTKSKNRLSSIHVMLDKLVRLGQVRLGQVRLDSNILKIELVEIKIN